MYIWKGRITVEKGSEGLVKTILEKYGLKPEEDNNEIYFNEEKDPALFNRTKANEILTKLREIGVKNAEIHAYSIIDIFKYIINGEGEINAEIR
jgi:hypothetical protein